MEYLHLLEEPRIQVSFKEMEMAAVIDEVFRRQSALGVIFVSDMTEHFIGRILREKDLEFFQLAKLRPRVFMRRGHPLASEPSVRLEQLYAYPYVVFTQSDSNYQYAEEAVVGTGAQFDQVVCVSDRATAYNVIAHTNCVSTGSGVLPEGFAGVDSYAMLAQWLEDRKLPSSTIENIFSESLLKVVKQCTM